MARHQQNIPFSRIRNDRRIYHGMFRGNRPVAMMQSQCRTTSAFANCDRLINQQWQCVNYIVTSPLD
jgi:hypothetical protein